MVDQTVKIANFPQPSYKERVAYDLMVKVLDAEYVSGQERSRKDILDLYAECLHAASGYRKYEGK